MDAGSIATLAIVAGLAIEKVLGHLNCYDGVRHLRCNMSSCCDVDIDRASSPATPPTSHAHATRLLKMTEAEADAVLKRAFPYEVNRVSRSFSAPTLHSRLEALSIKK